MGLEEAVRVAPGAGRAAGPPADRPGGRGAKSEAVGGFVGWPEAFPPGPFLELAEYGAPHGIEDR